MPDELTQVEAADRTVARCQGRLVGFHPPLPELPAWFGMANQGFHAGSTISKAGTRCRLSLRQSPESQPGLLEPTRLKPDYRAQRVVIGLTVVALIRPARLQYSLAKQALVRFDHRADGGFVFHPDGRTGPDHEDIAPKPTELQGAPTLDPVCRLALVEAVHSSGVEG